MALLRVLADILLYLALGLLAYWFFTQEIVALWAAIGSGLLSAILFIYTSDVKRSRRRHDYEPSSIWDWWFYSDLLEMPFRVILWLLKGIWHVFD